MNLDLINPKYYYIEFKKFMKYSVNPKDITAITGTVRQKIKGTWTIFVIKMFLTIIVGAITTIIYDPDNKTSARWFEEFSIPIIFFLSIIILPLLEEIAFRLSLKFKPIFLALTLGVFSYYFFTKAVYQTNLSNTEFYFFERTLISISIMIGSFFILLNNNIKVKLDLFWKTNFKWIFYFFCITFAWMHIFNYGITLKHVVLLPLITLPKLISAITFGYIRMHYGFIYSLGLHICWNSFGFTVSMISLMGGD